jgi:hypothetical protein
METKKRPHDEIEGDTVVKKRKEEEEEEQEESLDSTLLVVRKGKEKEEEDSLESIPLDNESKEAQISSSLLGL